MNAAEYLKGQGWRGAGFALHADRGLARPLLVSQRQDQAGLGTRKHDYGEQWWASAFDKSLKTLGQPVADATPPSTDASSKTPSKLNGLYSKFVKAETLGSTFQTNGDPFGPLQEPRHTAMNATPIPTVLDHPEKSSKRKHRDIRPEDDATAQPVTKKSKKSIEALPQPKEYIPPQIAEGQAEKVKKDKKRKKDVREDEKHESVLHTSSKTGAARFESPEPTEERPHTDSIMAVRRSGQHISLPGDHDFADPDDIRSALIRLYESGDKRGVKYLLLQTFPKLVKEEGQVVDANGKPIIGKTLKATKRARESAKRAAKKEAKHWVEVRANTHLYRPDGALIATPMSRASSQLPTNEAEMPAAPVQAVGTDESVDRCSRDQAKQERRAARKLAKSQRKQRQGRGEAELDPEDSSDDGSAADDATGELALDPSQTFVVETAGDDDAAPVGATRRELWKAKSRAERKARLEQKRRRRAERADVAGAAVAVATAAAKASVARTGRPIATSSNIGGSVGHAGGAGGARLSHDAGGGDEGGLSRKERRARRAARKLQLLDRMADDIIARDRRRQGFDDPEVRAAKTGRPVRVKPASKAQRKVARREARATLRRQKKGLA